MKAKLKKIFQNSLFLNICSIGTLFFLVVSVIIAVFGDVISIGKLIMLFIEMLLTMFLVNSFHRHDANLMKAMLAAILTMLAVVSINNIADNFQDGYFKECFEAGLPGIVYVVFEILVGIINVSLALDHFVLTKGHNSNEKIMDASRFVVFIGLILLVVQLVMLYFLKDSFPLELLIYYIMYNFAALFNLCLIVAIESKLDMFRQRREERARRDAE